MMRKQLVVASSCRNKGRKSIPLYSVWQPPLLLLLVIVLAQLGCKNLEVRDRWFDSDRVAELPSEILPIWIDTVLHQPGKPGVRGFGGRIYFYETGKPDPVKVDGQLVVYAFDGSSDSPDMVAPLRKFVFTPDQLKTHHSNTSLGNSYSVWIPWDKVGGESRTLSLVARFDGREGGTAMSKPSKMLLPGLDTSTPMENERNSKIQLASHDEVEAASQDTLLDTVSIDLSPSFQRRMYSADFGSGRAQALRSDAPSNLANSTNFATNDSTDFKSIGDSLDGLRRSASMMTTQSPRAQVAEAVSQQSPFANPIPELIHSEPVNSNWQSGARFSPQRFPARMTPRVQPSRAALRRQPHRAAWPAVLPPTPRSGSNWQSSPDSQALVSTRQENRRRRFPFQSQVLVEGDTAGFAAASEVAD